MAVGVKGLNPKQPSSKSEPPADFEVILHLHRSRGIPGEGACGHAVGNSPLLLLTIHLCGMEKIPPLPNVTVTGISNGKEKLHSWRQKG